MISILIPTLTGREHHLERLEVSIEDTCPDSETIIVKDFPNWGVAINEAAKEAEGDYLYLGSDDHEMLPGWAEAASAVCDKGQLPAPKMYNTDGTVQSCGNYYGDRATNPPDLPNDGTVVPFPRVPFLSREQWEALGPLLPIHFSDVFLGQKARWHGIDTVICHGYQLVHHFAQEGRLDYDEQERIRVETEAEIEKAMMLP